MRNCIIAADGNLNECARLGLARIELIANASIFNLNHVGLPTGCDQLIDKKVVPAIAIDVQLILQEFCSAQHCVMGL